MVINGRSRCFLLPHLDLSFNPCSGEGSPFGNPTKDHIETQPKMLVLHDGDTHANVQRLSEGHGMRPGLSRAFGLNSHSVAPSPAVDAAKACAMAWHKKIFRLLAE